MNEYKNLDSDGRGLYIIKENRFLTERTGQVFIQMISSRKALIFIKQREITQAVMNKKWSMLTQQEVSSQ